MKKITRIFAVLVIAAVLMAVFAVSSFATGEILDDGGTGNVSEGENASENENVENSENLGAENEPADKEPVEPDAGDENSGNDADEKVPESDNTTKEENAIEDENMPSDEISFVDRLAEYISGDKLSTTVTFAYNIFCTVILVLMKRSNKTSSSDLLRIITANNKSSKEKMNELTEVYNANEKEVVALKEEIKKLREEHKNKTVTAEQFTATLEGIRDIGDVLQTIYQNSSTVPVVIKTNVIKKVTELNEAIDKAEKSIQEEQK
jgi:hypothetical protein